MATPSPLVTKVHAEHKRWSSEFAALRKLCLATGLNEALKWGQACYDLDGRNVVLIHGFKDYYALLFMKGALLEDPNDILVQQTPNVQAARQIRFTGLADIAQRRAAVRSYLAKAIEVERLGAKVPMKAAAQSRFRRSSRSDWTTTRAWPRRFMRSRLAVKGHICCTSVAPSRPRHEPRASKSMRRES